MIGVVLAAGPGRRLGSLTEDLPKALLPVAGDRTILDVILGNLRTAGIDQVVVVAGFAAERIEERRSSLELEHELTVETILNPKAMEWNNAYSLWCAREAFAEGVLLVNGDTVHPRQVEDSLFARRGADVVLAVDDEKALGEEEMKVRVGENGRLSELTKNMEPDAAAGEYVGVALIEAHAAVPLAESLEATWRTDPNLYYEDGFQHFGDAGGVIGLAPIGDVGWVEVDNEADLERAREVACRY